MRGGFDLNTRTIKRRGGGAVFCGKEVGKLVEERHKEGGRGYMCLCNNCLAINV